MACPTCGGMFANNTKFLDHIRRQTSLDRKQSEKKGSAQAVLLGVGVGGTFPGEGAAEGILATSTFRAQSAATVPADSVIRPCYSVLTVCQLS